MRSSIAAGPALALALLGCTPLEVLDLSGEQTDLPLDAVAVRLDPAPHRAALARAGGALTFRSSVPADAPTCAATTGGAGLCADADADDLVDFWEELLLDRLRPLVRMHADEPLFREREDFFRSPMVLGVGRVTPARETPGRIRAFVLLVYDRDYGRCSVAGHRGDVERVVYDLARTEDGVTVVGVYTAAHEYTPFDGSRALYGERLQELELVEDRVSGDLRPVVYASAGKHATYVSRRACGAHGAVPCQRESCPGEAGADRALLFPIFNAGEPGRPLPLLSRLNVNFEAWAPVPFCGFGPVFHPDNTRCVAPVEEKLRKDPFAGHADR